MTFNEGDRVRVINYMFNNVHNLNGQEGTVTEVIEGLGVFFTPDSDDITICGPDGIALYFEELEVI